MASLLFNFLFVAFRKDLKNIQNTAMCFNLIQSNLPIPDKLYSGHLVIADTFSWIRLNQGQIYIEKPLCSGQLL